MHLNNPFDRPNPFRAKQHTTNLIYQEPNDLLSRMSRRKSQHGIFLPNGSHHINHSSTSEVQFIDLSLKEPSRSKLDFLKLNNPYLAARDEPVVLTSRTNTIDPFSRATSFSSYQRPANFYRTGALRLDDYQQDSPMKNFEELDLQGSRRPAVPSLYSPPTDYTAMNNLMGKLLDRATEGTRTDQQNYNQHEPYRDAAAKKPPQFNPTYEPSGNFKNEECQRPELANRQSRDSRGSKQSNLGNNQAFPTQVHFEDRSVDETVLAVFDQALKLVSPEHPQIPESVTLDGIRYELVDIRTPRR